MKKSKIIKRLIKSGRLLEAEVELQGTIIENQRQEILRLDDKRVELERHKVDVEQAIRGVRAGQAESATGSRDFGRGWSQCMGDVEAALLRVQLDKRLMGGPVPDEYSHYINVGPHGWTVQHPLSCRPNLFGCPLTKAAEAHDWSVMEVEPYPSGTYPCAVTETGELVIDLGAPVTPFPIKDNPQA